jgi:subtilisin-like proprotein convertase family protein
MKTIFGTIFIAVVLTTISCSKDDPKPAPITPSAAFSGENNTVTDIPDSESNNTPGIPVISEINITTDGIIKNPEKVIIELDLQHKYCSDLVVEIIAPDGSSTALIKRYGALSLIDVNFVTGNKLSFNSTFTNWIDADPIPTGNYAPLITVSTAIQPSTITITPLANFFENKATIGKWKLKVTDYNLGDVGKLNAWKISFAEGALK